MVARDGVEALDYLFGRGDHAGRDPRDLPALVLLDLNLPKLDGREVMQAIRAEPTTHTLPVVALTTSAEPDEVEACTRWASTATSRSRCDFSALRGGDARSWDLYWLVLNQGPPP